MMHSKRCKLLPSDIDNALKVFGIEVSNIQIVNIIIIVIYGPMVNYRYSYLII